MKRLIAICLVATLVTTAFSLLVEYEFCIDGPGRGLPAAVTHPSHGTTPLEFPYSGDAIEGRVLDGKSLGINLAVWAVIVGLSLGLVDRKARRRSESLAQARPLAGRRDVGSP